MTIRGGIDLGGTKIQVVVVSADNSVLGQSRRPTPRDNGPEGVVEAMVAAVREATDAAGIAADTLSGVGVGSPGAIDTDAGTVAHARNLPEWDSPFALAARLSDDLGTRVVLENDVQVAVDAEVELGAGRGYASVLGVFWGTGVGGGIVLEGKPWLGRGAAGEIGHMVVKQNGAPCPCGRRGCMEAYAGRAAMEATARERAMRGEKTHLFEFMEKADRTRLTSGVWAKALAHEDPLAVKLVDRAIAALGTGIASAVNLLDVEAVVIGGGLGTRLGERYARKIERAMLPHLFVSERPPDVHVAALGDLGGAIGASLLVR